MPQPFGLIIPGKDVIINFVPDMTGTKFTLEIPFPISPSNSMDTNTLSSPSPPSSSSTSPPSDSTLPSSVHDLVFFLLPNTPLPPDTGALLYWSASLMTNPNASASHIPVPTESSGFELLGALTPTQTSTILRTGWSSHDQLQQLIDKCTSPQPQHPPQQQQSTPYMTMSSPNPYSGIQITLGVSLEPLFNIANLQILDPGRQNQARVENKKNVAKHIATDLFNYLQSFDDTGSGGNGVKDGWMMVPVNVFDRWFKRFEGKIGRDPNFFMKSSVE